MAARCFPWLIAALLLCGSAAAIRTKPATCDRQRYDVYHKWTVSMSACDFFQPGNTSRRNPSNSLSPSLSDCILTRATSINGVPQNGSSTGSMPGPTIFAKKGDWVRIDVISKLLSTEISLHFHGIDQIGTPWADGPVGITTCPTGGTAGMNYPPTTTSIWLADTPGTYFYHGHAGLEDAQGFMGAIIIYDPEDPHRQLYDAELPVSQSDPTPMPLQMRDWWRLAPTMMQFPFFTLDLALVNGYYGNGTAEYPSVVFDMAKDTCYRIRFINSNTEWPGWEVSIKDKVGETVQMLMIAFNEMNLKPFWVDSFAFYIGHRMDAVVCTGSDDEDLVLHFNTHEPETGICASVALGACNNTAILRVGGLTSSGPSKVNQTLLESFPFYETLDAMKTQDLLVPYVPIEVPANEAGTYDQKWKVMLSLTSVATYLWTEKNWGFELPSAPILFTNGGKCGTVGPPPGKKGAFNSAYLQKTLKLGEVVEMLFENMSPWEHPIHVHGNNFVVLGSKFLANAGTGGYSNNQTICPYPIEMGDPSFTDPYTANTNKWACPYNETDAQQYMFESPYMTDTFALPPYSWTLVRVRFDNPGSWFLHCHINHHMIEGMGFAINVALDKVAPLPRWVNTDCLPEDCSLKLKKC